MTMNTIFSGVDGVPRGCRPVFRLHPLMVCLVLAGITGCLPAQAKDYFDPSFLNDGSGTPVDLSAYETAGAIPEGTYMVDVYLNQVKQFTRQMAFVKDANGQVNPQLTPAMLQKMGVLTSHIDGLKGLAADKPLGDLTKLIPASTVQFSMATLRLDITVPQVDVDQQVAGQVDPALWDEGMPALLFSYNLNGSQNRMTGEGRGNTTRNLFGSVTGGANLGAWRLRSTMTRTEGWSNGYGDQSHYAQTQFNNTYLQRDVQRLRGELTLGEGSSGGDVFDSIPFRGVKLASSDEMLPSSQRGFSPVITGTAQSNARVSVSQNGNVIYETNVPPGPFRLTDVYNAGNGGTLVVTVTEANGSKHVSTQAYSTLPVMQRQGGLEYEVTAGRYHNGGYTEGSRDPLFALVTAKVGLPGYLTLYGGLLGASGYQSAVTGLGVSLGALGAVSVDATLARAHIRDSDEDADGAAFRARYSKSMTTTGTTVDLTAYRYATRRFFSFQDAMSAGFSLQQGYAPWLAERRRSSWQLSLSQTLGALGSVFLRATRDDYWGSERVVNSVSSGFSSSVAGVGYSVSYDVDHTEKGNNEWPTNRQLSLNVSVPFSIFNPASTAVQGINANYSMTHDNRGRTQQQAGLSGSLLDSRLSWNASQSMDNQGSGSAGNLGVGYTGDHGTLGAGYGYASGSRTWSANASGGVVVHPHGVSFTRMLGDSMALVEAPGADGVKVMGGSATADSRGYAVVPYLQNYQRNVLSLDPSTLPDGVDVGEGSAVVYPTKGAIVEAKFKTRVGRQAMLTLTYNGKPVPFGAMASLPGEDDPSAAIVGDAGMVYLTGAPQQGVLNVQWGNSSEQQCRVNYDLGPKPATTGKDVSGVNIVQQTLTCQPVAGGQGRPATPAPMPAATP